MAPQLGIRTISLIILPAPKAVPEGVGIGKRTMAPQSSPQTAKGVTRGSRRGGGGGIVMGEIVDVYGG